MKAGYLAAAAAAVMATLPSSAAAGNYAYFDRPDDANVNSQAAVSNDVYVRGFGWAWGELRFKQDPGATSPSERQACDNLGRRDAAPGHHNEDSSQPRTPRGKISMNLAWVSASGTPAGRHGPRERMAATVVR